jgi:hypothetical protein
MTTTANDNGDPDGQFRLLASSFMNVANWNAIPGAPSADYPAFAFECDGYRVAIYREPGDPRWSWIIYPSHGRVTQNWSLTAVEAKLDASRELILLIRGEPMLADAADDDPW